MAFSVASLRGKLVLLAIGTTLITAGSIAFSHYLSGRELADRTALESMRYETQIQADRFLVLFDQMEQDAALLAGTPPIQGLIRTLRSADGRDPRDGSTAGLWRERLSEIFRSFLGKRLHYTQARYIGWDDGGRELVRVNREDGHLVALSAGEMQRKGDEPYMRNARDLDRGEIYFSPVTLNREHGSVDAANVPTIRAVMAIHTEAGEPFGVIVLNADFERMLRRANPLVKPGSRLVAASDSGHFMMFASSIRLPRLREDYEQAPDLSPDIKDLLSSGASRGSVVADETIAYAMTLPLGRQNETGLKIVETMHREALLQSVNTVLTRDLAISVAILVIAAGAAGLLGLRLTRPLNDLTNAIRSPEARERFLELEFPQGDEIGEMADAFRDMTNDLIFTTRRAQAVFDGAADGFVTICGKGTIEALNPAAARIFGYERFDLVGRSVGTLIPDLFDDKSLIQMVRTGDGEAVRAAIEGITRKRGIEGLRRSGQRFPIEISISTSSAVGRTVIIAVIRDISMRKAQEDHLRKLVRLLAESKEDLERSNAELDKFAYVASHDLKAPLRVIDNASRWLEEDMEAHFDDDTRESMDMIRSRVARMEKLLDDLLQHSRIGRVEEKTVLVPGTELIDDVVALSGVPAGFSVVADPSFATLTLPQMPLRCVLMNLVSNAVKHHDRQDGEIRISITEKAEHFVFTVADDGPGIEPKFHQKVFEMFKTLQPRDKVEGSGMGLSIVKKHVELSGGTITLSSGRGEGCCFTFTWPKPAPGATLEDIAA